jgi:molybdate transport system permease protein
MTARTGSGAARSVGVLMALALLALLLLPIVALVISSGPSDLSEGVRHPLFLPALALSAKTTVLSLVIVVAGGTPLAWWLANGRGKLTRVVEVLVVLPIVVPPAVLGIALLQAFGRSGVLGPLLNAIDLQLPFTTAGVVIAQVVVSAPFYVESAAIAFRRVDVDSMLVARTLGASPATAFFRVAVPIAASGLLGGAALAYARSIGEFGATLLFAGNLTGTTQTMPLAIYMALESDVRAAIAISLVLATIAVILLFAVRVAPQAFTSRALERSDERTKGENA